METPVVMYVHISGRPRRNFIFRAIRHMQTSGVKSMQLRGDLLRQMQWWINSLSSRRAPSSYFWKRQPDTPLVCSDASGEDGWGACAMGLHIAGPWPREWQQSAGAGAPHMLFKEMLAPVVTSLLLAPFVPGAVFACATDNAGAAFVLNSLSCACPETLKLLRPLSDGLTRAGVGLVADHAHRERNAHTDDLSHALPMRLWSRCVAQAQPARHAAHTMVHFAIMDTATGEAFTASMSFPRLFVRGARDEAP